MEGISSSFASMTSAPSEHGKDDNGIEVDDDGPMIYQPMTTTLIRRQTSPWLIRARNRMV